MSRTYKRLYGPAQLTFSAADLYTCPADTVARVLNVHASNPSDAPVDINLAISSFLSTPILDDFNRADGSIHGDEASSGYSWSSTYIDGSAPNDPLTITSNQLGIGDSGDAYLTSDFGPDCQSYMTVQSIASDGSVQLKLRIQGEGAPGYDSYYLLVDGDGYWSIRRQNPYSELQGDSLGVPAAGEKIGFRAIGTTLQSWLYSEGAWSLQQETSDSGISAAGPIGISLYDSGTGSSVIDDFGGGPASLSLFDDRPLAGGEVLSEHYPYELAAGEKLQGWADTDATVVLTITGFEEPA